MLWAAGEPDYRYGFSRFAYMEQSMAFPLYGVVPPWAKNRCFIYYGNKDIVVKWLNDKELLRFAAYAFFVFKTYLKFINVL